MKKFKIEWGLEIGQKAREAHREGILVAEKDLNEAAEQTTKLANSKDVSTIFEGTFLSNNYVAKADILIRQNSGWKLVEVKSSVNDKSEFIEDLKGVLSPIAASRKQSS